MRKTPVIQKRKIRVFDESGNVVATEELLSSACKFSPMTHWLDNWKDADQMWAKRSQVYNRFGIAAHTASEIEGKLVIILSAVYHKEKTFLAIEDYYRLFAEHSRKTLGQLVKLFRERASLPEYFDETVTEALDRRNYLIHRFFRDKADDFKSPNGCDALVTQLVTINDSLDAADQYLGDLLDSWLRSRGIDPEEVPYIEDKYRNDLAKG
jgi:hypothetical protein